MTLGIPIEVVKWLESLPAPYELEIFVHYVQMSDAKKIVVVDRIERDITSWRTDDDSTI